MFKRIEVAETTSTNTYLKDLISDDDIVEGTIVLSHNQTQGKGQQGNSWESEAGKNLTFSLFLKPEMHASHMFVISKLISVAIINSLKKLNIEARIKWPNDIYFHDKKLGGILIENQLLGSQISYSIVGIGINVNQEKFISDAPNPVSLKNITAINYSLGDVLDGFLSEFERLYDSGTSLYDIEDTYWNNLYRNSGLFEFRADNERFNAVIKKVENDGQLLLEKDNGETVGFYFKEVEFVI